MTRAAGASTPRCPVRLTILLLILPVVDLGTALCRVVNDRAGRRVAQPAEAIQALLSERDRERPIARERERGIVRDNRLLCLQEMTAGHRVDGAIGAAGGTAVAARAAGAAVECLGAARRARARHVDYVALHFGEGPIRGLLIDVADFRYIMRGQALARVSHVAEEVLLVVIDPEPERRRGGRGGVQLRERAARVQRIRREGRDTGRRIAGRPTRDVRGG